MSLISPKYHSIKIQNSAKSQYPNLDLILESLERLHYASNDALKISDLNAAYRIACSPASFDQDTQNRILNLIHESGRPNWETSLIAVEMLREGGHSSYNIIQMIKDWGHLKNDQIQMILFRHAVDAWTFKRDPLMALNQALALAAYFKRLSVPICNGALNYIVSLYAHAEETQSGLAFLQYRLMDPIPAFSRTNIHRLLESIDATVELQKLVSMNRRLMAKLWSLVDTGYVSRRMFSHFIARCVDTGDSDTLVSISETLETKDLKMQQQVFPVLMDAFGDTRLSVPDVALKVWLASGFTKDERSWKWILGSVGDRKQLDSFYSLLKQLVLNGPKIAEADLVVIVDGMIEKLGGQHVGSDERLKAALMETSRGVLDTSESEDSLEADLEAFFR
jgi:hypothetical protein